MASVWLTYAWVDNEELDVDFVVQELARAGLTVKGDRWNLGAGQRLWDQIASFIQDPDQCDAWLIYATENSLVSEPCKEELGYALDRALNARGTTFPIIGLFPGPVDRDLIPAPIRSRLYVSLTDHHWTERIKAAAEGRPPIVGHPDTEPYFKHVHEFKAEQTLKYVIEVRPRAGSWSPFIACIPIGEKNDVNPQLAHGPHGQVPKETILRGAGAGLSDDKTHWCVWARNQANPTESYYLFCDRKPSKLVFGPKGRAPQYEVGFRY